jgi:Protein of unknown function (DUF3102)
MSITSTKTQELKFPVLAEHADAIRRLGRQTAENIIEIGRRLTLCKKEISHGDWSGWLKQEFDWSDQQARRFMHVFELAESKSNKLLNLNLPVSSLYLLAAPSTPEVARSEIIERAKNGAPVSVDEVKGTIAAAKGDVSKPVAKPTMAATTTAAKGRKQQARKGWSRERWRRHKERKRGHRSKNATPAAAPPTPAQARQDIGPAGTGEVERLRARVDELQAELRLREIKITGLESENGELKAANAELCAKLEAAACAPVATKNGSRGARGASDTGTPAARPPKNGGRAATSPTRCDGSDPVQSASANTPTIEERAAAIAAKGVQEPIPDFLLRKPTEVVS